jgi:hypothetical protein
MKRRKKNKNNLFLMEINDVAGRRLKYRMILSLEAPN